jgi:hypothetical protein
MRLFATRLKEFVPTSPPKRPNRMLRNGRVEDQVFGDAENLYRRYSKEHWVGDTFVSAGFKFPRPSVNREKYSQPEDVVYSDDGKFTGWGVLEFRVENIPQRLVDGAGRPYLFFPWHTPEEDNYAHSEIWCESESQRGQHADPSSQTKKRFRTILSQHVRVRIAATM